ncbi:MAG: DNA polymerase III subunit delta' [Chloroflexi bacterium]|nr:DNA polymerase III subunit delta' [Chloroflexota bacterium]
MSSWRIVGQEHITRPLSSALARGQMSHAYLIGGRPLGGKSLLAQAIAQALNCTDTDPPCGRCSQCQRISRGIHSDVQVITVTPDPETKRMRTVIALDQVREMEQRAALGPYEGKHLVFIIDPAEKLHPTAANALLKTLEEPPPRVTLLLLSGLEQELLPTIQSRCQRLELAPLSAGAIVQVLTQEHSVAPDDAALLARLSTGRLGWALAAAKDPKVLEGRQHGLESLMEVLDNGLERRFQVAQEVASQFSRSRPAAQETLGLWLGWWRDLLLIKTQAPQLIANSDWQSSLEERAARYSASQARTVVRELLATLERLEANANPRLALDVLMLSLPQPADKARPTT